MSLLTAIGGLAIGLLAADSNFEAMLGLAAIANIVLGTIGFVISGVKATSNRWQHLLAVAIGVWLLSFFNVIFGFAGIFEWILAASIALGMMAIGGAIASAIKQ